MNGDCTRVFEKVRRTSQRLPWGFVHALGVCALCAGCAGQEPAEQAAPNASAPAAAGTSSVTGSDGSEEIDAGEPPLFASDPLLQHCGSRPAARTPESIAEVVQAINQQPKPLTLGCFLRTFARPLSLQASRGFISAQPSMGDRSPRLFIFSGKLVMTVVPAGPGSALFEMGEFVTETRTLKAELHFPVAELLGPSAPFEDLDTPLGTSCRGCHAEEVPSLEFPGAYVSDALKPAPYDVVDLAGLAQEAVGCDVYAEAERCGLLHGVFAYGAVTPGSFPESVRVFH